MCFQGVKPTPSPELLSKINNSFFLFLSTIPTWSKINKNRTVFTVGKGPLNGGCTMLRFEQDEIERVTILLELCMRDVFLGIPIRVFSLQINVMFGFSFKSSYSFVEKINPIVDYLIFGVLLNRFKVKFFIASFDVDDKVWSLSSDFYCFGVEVEKLIDCCLISADS